jgi:hypothetical protein
MSIKNSRNDKKKAWVWVCNTARLSFFTLRSRPPRWPGGASRIALLEGGLATFLAPVVEANETIGAILRQFHEEKKDNGTEPASANIAAIEGSQADQLEIRVGVPKRVETHGSGHDGGADHLHTDDRQQHIAGRRVKNQLSTRAPSTAICEVRHNNKNMTVFSTADE